MITDVLLRNGSPRSSPSTTSRNVKSSSVDGSSFSEDHVRTVQTPCTDHSDHRHTGGHENTPIPHVRVMTEVLEHNPPRSHTPSSLFSLPTGVSPVHSPDHSEESTLDRPIQFLREFRNINALRHRVQNLRVRARDERERMKITRRRMRSELARTMRLGRDATQQLQALEKIEEELDSQELVYDFLESDLIPAEWKLIEAEQTLYEDILGDAAFDASGADLDALVIPSTWPDLPFADATMDILARQAELTPTERLLALESADRDLRMNLAYLDSTHKAVIQQSEMQAAAGLPVDRSSHRVTDNYMDRRGALLRQLASIAEARTALASSPTVASDTITADDVLFRCDQFADVDADTSLPSADSRDDENLSLSGGDFDKWRDDIPPLLAHPVLDVGQADNAVQSFPTNLESQYPDSAGDIAESLTTFVSRWILQCIRSSWWSLLRFVSEGSFGRDWSYKTIEKYMFQTWYWEDALSVSHSRLPVDLESLRTSQLPEEKDSSQAGGEEMHVQPSTKQYRSSSLIVLELDRPMFESVGGAHTR